MKPVTLLIALSVMCGYAQAPKTGTQEVHPRKNDPFACAPNCKIEVRSKFEDREVKNWSECTRADEINATNGYGKYFCHRTLPSELWIGNQMIGTLEMK